MANLNRNLNPTIVGQSSRDFDQPPETDVVETYSNINLSGYVMFAVFLILPFFFGGRGLSAAHIIKLILFLSLITLSAISLLNRFTQKDSDSQNIEPIRKEKSKIFFYFLPICLYLLFQNLSLPLEVLSYFSEPATVAYLKSNSSSGSISMDRSESINAFSWVFLFIALYCVNLNVPYEKLHIKQKHRALKNSKNTVFFSKSSREYDFYAELMQKIVIGVSLFCAAIGVSHLMLQLHALFGVFTFADDYQFSWRAHWPFVNANQLSVMIEMGLMLSFTRFLRERQLRTLTMTKKSDEGIIKNIEHLFYSLEKQAVSLMIVFFLGIALILTMSRAGIALAFLGMSLLWFVYKLNPVVLIGSGDDRRRRGDSNEASGMTLVVQKSVSFFKIAAFPVLVFLFCLFYLGEDVSSRLSSRVDQTVSQSGDSSRASLNKITWEVLKLNPLFGVGLNNWKGMADQFSYDDTVGWHLDYAHNDYLQVLSEIGIIGLICMILPLIPATKNLLKIKDVYLGPVRKVFISGLFLSFVVPALHALVDFPYHLPILSLGILFAFLIISRGIVFILKSENQYNEV